MFNNGNFKKVRTKALGASQFPYLTRCSTQKLFWSSQTQRQPSEMIHAKESSSLRCTQQSLTQIRDVAGQLTAISAGEILHRLLARCSEDVSVDGS